MGSVAEVGVGNAIDGKTIDAKAIGPKAIEDRNRTILG